MNTKVIPLIISHRGNLSGPNTALENSPSLIEGAIRLGFDVEIDVWLIDGQILLGHDAPAYEVNADWLNSFQDKLWCHAKNHEAFLCLKLLGFNTFWHQNDDFALTTHGYVWAYPGRVNDIERIEVLVNATECVNMRGVLGICTDYPFVLRSNSE